MLQGFYLSKQFQGLRFETKDYREHPVLGGISSTRWSAYEAFASENSKLVDTLSRLAGTSYAVQLGSKKEAEQWAVSFLETLSIDVIESKDHSLRSSGFLSGNKANNRLTGSPKADVLMGWAGRDVIIGGKHDDVLCGGQNADRFFFTASHAGTDLEKDVIVDFNGEEGDRIAFSMKAGSLVSEFSGKRGEATISTWIAKLLPSNDEPIYPWMYSGTLIEFDRNGDKIADLQIDLPGVSSMRRNWIVFSQ